MTTPLRDRLAEALQAQQLVRFHTRFEASAVHGYVQAIGPRFVLLAMVNDRIRYDGFECFRIADLRGWQLEPNAAFIETALRPRGLRPATPTIEIQDLRSLLESANQAFPLLSVHREQLDPETCQIGRIVGLDRQTVDLLEIRPDASWWDSPSRYRLRDITRVAFGGDYEDALQLVGGAAFPGVGTSAAGRLP